MMVPSAAVVSQFLPSPPIPHYLFQAFRSYPSLRESFGVVEAISLSTGSWLKPPLLNRIPDNPTFGLKIPSVTLNLMSNL